MEPVLYGLELFVGASFVLGAWLLIRVTSGKVHEGLRLGEGVFIWGWS